MGKSRANNHRAFRRGCDQHGHRHVLQYDLSELAGPAALYRTQREPADREIGFVRHVRQRAHGSRPGRDLDVRRGLHSPSFGLNVPIAGSLLFTTSVGYTYRGPFNRESAFSTLPPGVDPALVANLIDVIPTVRIDPGENTTVTAAINYGAGSFAAGLTGATSWESPTIVRDVPTFRPGLRYLLSFQSSYKWPEKWGVTELTAAAAHSNRNKLVFETATPTLERFNSNSNVYRVGLRHLFPVDQFQIGPVASFLYRDHNGYNSTTLQFVPQKTRWAAGMLAQYAPNASVTLNARVEHVWTRENESPTNDDVKLDVLAKSRFRHQRSRSFPAPHGKRRSVSTSNYEVNHDTHTANIGTRRGGIDSVAAVDRSGSGSMQRWQSSERRLRQRSYG